MYYIIICYKWLIWEILILVLPLAKFTIQSKKQNWNVLDIYSNTLFLIVKKWEETRFNDNNRSHFIKIFDILFWFNT